MKQFLIACLLILGFTSATAETYMARNSVRYVRHHAVYTNEKGEMNVVDINLEWPEWLDFNLQRPLKQRLSQLLWYSSLEDLTSNMQAELQNYGHRLTQQLDSLPDDSKFCYATYRLTKLGFSEGRYISFLVEKHIVPAALSSQKACHHLAVLTYDLQQQHLFNGEELFKSAAILNNDYNAYVFGNALTAGLQQPLDGEIAAQVILGPAPINDEVMQFFIGQDSTHLVASVLPIIPWKRFLTKPFKALLKEKALPVSYDSPIPMLTPWANDTTICQNPDTPAIFSAQGQSLSDYITAHLSLPKATEYEGLSKQGVVCFIVENDGTLSQCVMQQTLSPSADRALVDVLFAMPHWKPATQSGRKVRSVVQLPIKLK